MEDQKEFVIIKILSELQEKYDINNMDVKNLLDKHLSEYSLISNETALMVSDLSDKIKFFIGLKSLEGLSKQSLRRYQEELSMFGRYVLKPVAQITVNDIRRYFATIQSARDYSKVTINGKISILRSFFGTLYREEVIPKDPTVRIKNIKVDVKSLREHLTTEELEIIRNVCINIREKALIEFLYSTGCRVSEVVESRLIDINWDSNSLIVHGKGDKYRTVYFSVKCKLYLKEYIQNRNGDNESLFIGERSPYRSLTKAGLEKIVKKIASRTNIKKSISPHIFRHTFATLALQRGMDITIIQQLLGHSEINTTQIYAKTNTRQLQIAYEKFIAA
ncbi:integrase/recombinase XerD [Sedimentibacter acidaminivorans]|uniref:Integrase/recombinase XerD n=1 Tax=Sedimentibacter acidaminivorans TaxID=913099 RepID=A0ABS4GA70_9FIRM|nr:site-specific tyrosine recombinase/integron integrase [Sedimentibacter acidaminivorans]MBP1924573.1 integrase/recombinase XerD [Sedimentibacter acidaminivorans]